MFAVADGIEKLASTVERFGWDLQAGHLPAGQYHNDPARHRQIAFLAGAVSPAPLFVLSFDDEVDG